MSLHILKSITIWVLHFLKTEQYIEAIESFDKNLEKDTSNAQGHFNKGIALLKLGRYEEALEAFDKALIYDPENALAFYHKGRSYAGLNQS